MSIHVYCGGTNNAKDGARVSQDNESRSTPITFRGEGIATEAHIRCDNGTKTSTDVVVSVVSTSGVADSDFLVSANNSDWLSSVNLGVIEDVNVPVYIKQINRKGSGASTQINLHVNYGGAIVDIPTAPTVNTLSTTSASTSGFSILATVTVGDTGDTLTSLKYVVKNATSENPPAAPDSADWALSSPSGDVVACGTMMLTGHKSGDVYSNVDQAITGLSAGTDYWVWVKATESNTLTATYPVITGVKVTTATAMQPGFTSGPSTSDITSQGWRVTAAVNGNTTAVFLGVRATDSNTYSDWTWTDITSDIEANGYTTVTGKTTGTWYYRVKLENATFSGANGVIAPSIGVAATSVSVAAPAKVGTVTPAAQQTTVALSWPAVTGADGYDVEYDTEDTFTGASVVSPDPTGTTCTITGLTANTAYFFRVRAHDSASNVGAYSDTVTATTAILYDTFSDSSFNTTNLWKKEDASGTVTETTSLACVSPEGNNANLSAWGITNPIAASQKVTCVLKSGSASMTDGMNGFVMVEDTVCPSEWTDWASTVQSPKWRIYANILYSSGHYYFQAFRRDAAGTVAYYHFSGAHAGTWYADGVFPAAYFDLGTSCPNVRVEFTRKAAGGGACSVGVFNDDTGSAIIDTHDVTVKSDGNSFFVTGGDSYSNAYTTESNYIYKRISIEAV